MRYFIKGRIVPTLLERGSKFFEEIVDIEECESGELKGKLKEKLLQIPKYNFDIRSHYIVDTVDFDLISLC